jgi:hypothetical protein
MVLISPTYIKTKTWRTASRNVSATRKVLRRKYYRVKLTQVRVVCSPLSWVMNPYHSQKSYYHNPLGTSCTHYVNVSMLQRWTVNSVILTYQVYLRITPVRTRVPATNEGGLLTVYNKDTCKVYAVTVKLYDNKSMSSHMGYLSANDPHAQSVKLKKHLQQNPQ